MEDQCYYENGIRLDFADGLHMMIPPSWKTVHVKIKDRNAGTCYADKLLELPDSRNTYVSIGMHYFIDYEVTVMEPETGEILLMHSFNASGRHVCINLTPGKLGDQIAWMPPAIEFRKKHNCKLTVAMEKEYSQMFASKYMDIRFMTPEEIVDKNERFYAAYHVGVFDDISYNPSDYRKNNLVDHADDILGTDSSQERPFVADSIHDYRKDYGDYICITTTASRMMKMWNYKNGWETLVDMLKKEGYMVFDISQNDAFIPGNAEDDTGSKPLIQRISMLRGSKLFIGLPSGLSWVAWACRIPVVLISGFSNAKTEFYTKYRVSPPENTPCVNCYNRLSNRWNGFDDCPENMDYICTKSITPEMVFKKCMEALKKQ